MMRHTCGQMSTDSNVQLIGDKIKCNTAHTNYDLTRWRWNVHTVTFNFSIWWFSHLVLVHQKALIINKQRLVWQLRPSFCLLVCQRFSIKGNFVCQIFMKFRTRVLHKAPSKRTVHSDSHTAGTSHISWPAVTKQRTQSLLVSGREVKLTDSRSRVHLYCTFWGVDSN